jgi:hypothetical protein
MSTIANSPFLPNQCAGSSTITPVTISLQQAYANNGAYNYNITSNTTVSSSFSDGYLTVPLYSENGDYLNNAYVMVFTNTSGNYNLAGNAYTGYFKFQGLDTAENAAYIICVGGGGAGGSTTGSQSAGPGVGGGGGGTSLFWFNSFDSAYTYAVNVGAGGAPSYGYGGQASGGGSSFIDTLIPTSSNGYSLNYNLMTSGGGGGGAGNIGLGGNTTPGGSGGGTTGIPNWGTYQLNNVDNIGIGTFNGGGGGNYNGTPGSSSMPGLTSLKNGYATTYNNELPWLSYLQNFVPQIQNSYGGGGAAGGSVTATYEEGVINNTTIQSSGSGGSNGNYYSRGGQNGLGGAYLQPNIANFSGSSGYSYGDGGGGAYYSESQVTITSYSFVYEGGETVVYSTAAPGYQAAPGGNGCQGCVIVVMIPGYSSLACNPSTDPTINPAPPTPAPLPPLPPPPPPKSSSASAESSMSSDEIDCCEMTVSTSPLDQDNTIENINFIKKILASPEYNTIYTALKTDLRYLYLNYIQSSRLYSVFKKFLHLIYYGSSKVRFYKQIPGSSCNYRSLVFMDTRRAYHIKSNVDLSINIICVGGGGGGGEYLNGGIAGGGGAGGSINLKTINLINNELYEIKVGAGGQGAYDYYIYGSVGNGNNGAYGGTSSVNSFSDNQTLISANGGGGGCGNYTGGTGNYGSNSINGTNGGNGGKGSYTTLTGHHGTYYFNQPGSSNTTQITSIMPDYQNILNYFDTNNLQLTINGTLCQNIIQNVYGGGGGGGYYGTYTNNGVSVYGLPSVTGYSNGLPGGNGSGGTSGLAYYTTNGTSQINVNSNNANSNFISGGGGGLCISHQPNNGYGGQGLVMMYWQASTTNEEEEKEGIKETGQDIKETGAIKEAMVDNEQKIDYCLLHIARVINNYETCIGIYAPVSIGDGPYNINMGSYGSY